MTRGKGRITRERKNDEGKAEWQRKGE